MKIKECKTCVDFLYANPNILDAAEFARIIIGNKRTAPEVVVMYLSAYHGFDHDKQAMDKWIWSITE